MDSHYLQQQRSLFSRRAARLRGRHHHLFHSALVHWWQSLQTHPIFGSVLAQLDTESPAYKNEIAASVSEGVPLFDSEKEQLAFTFRLVQHCALKPIDGSVGPEAMVGRLLASTTKFAEAQEAFFEAYVEPLCDYLLDALDEQRAVLSLLLKYKRKVEWFERTEVLALSEKGERKLAEHLYAYLFDQGLDFHIEPKSVSGNADLVAHDLVLDAKVFDGATRSTSYVKSGVNQLLTYAKDFHQSVGYLVIYKICPADLQFSFDRPDSLVPFLTVAGRTLYMLVVDVWVHDASASKRGPLRTYELTESELRTVLEAAEEEGSRAFFE